MVRKDLPSKARLLNLDIAIKRDQIYLKQYRMWWMYCIVTYLLMNAGIATPTPKRDEE